MSALFTQRAFLRRALETSPGVKIAVMPGPPWWIGRALEFGASALCLGWDGNLTRWVYQLACLGYDVRGAVRAAQERGVKVGGGIANTPEDVRFILRQGIEEIWTDDLLMARAVLQDWRE